MPSVKTQIAIWQLAESHRGTGQREDVRDSKPAGALRTQRSKRSRQLIENKDGSFSRTSESRQVTQNRYVMRCKAVNCQKYRGLANCEGNLYSQLINGYITTFDSLTRYSTPRQLYCGVFYAHAARLEALAPRSAKVKNLTDAAAAHS